MQKSEKNYWPHFIVGLVIFAAILGVWTIKAAMDNPVELDNSYMLNYHSVNEDINEILKKQQIFDRNYEISLLSPKISYGKNEIVVLLKDKDGNLIKDGEIKILFTRPDTTKFDKKIEPKYEKNGYKADVILDKEGRWNLIVKAKVGDAEGFKTFKLSTLE